MVERSYRTVGKIMQAGINTDVAPPNQLQIIVGETVTVQLSAKYRGPAIAGKIHVTFGKKNGSFNEDGNKQADIDVNMGPHTDWRTYTFNANVVINGDTGTFDLYAKIISIPGKDIFTPTYLDVLEVVGEPEFQGFGITDYSKA